MRKTRDPRVGAIVDGRYRIAAKLGEGGMAVVYLAHHATLDRHVALKILRPALAKSTHAIRRFAREARAASLIDHENVVSMLDFGLAPEGFYYLAMEYVAGTPLDAELVRVAPFPAARAAHLVAQIGAGVAAGHALGIVHRDLKPENVMLTTRGSETDFVKVVDFGLAKPSMEDAAAKLTQPGDLFGTPEYMAPEQWRAEGADARTDLYAIGVILYELLSGKMPFEGANPIDLMHAHLGTEPVPPSQRAPGLDIPPVLESICLRCLRKDPAQRYERVDDMLAELGGVWEQVRPPSRRTTYHRTCAAPPRRPDVAPDPTVFQPHEVDPVWDGPVLADEITRLQGLRRRRLAELADALWPDTLPDRVVALRSEIATLEAKAEASGQRVALAQAALEDLDQTARAEEAQHRLAMVEANIARAAGHAPSLSEEVSPTAETVEHDDPAVRLRRAERRLASLASRTERRRGEQTSELEQALAEQRSIELSLSPLYEELSKHVHAAARGRRELRPLVNAYGEVDGALASYEALLRMWDEA